MATRTDVTGSRAQRSPIDRSIGGKFMRVGIPRPLDKLYDYAPPSGMPAPSIGARVRVPLGRTSAVGVVMGYTDASRYELKEILDVIDHPPLLGSDVVRVTQWMADYYHCPIGVCLDTVLPSAARRGVRSELRDAKVWTAVEGDTHALARRAPRQFETWQLLRSKGPLVDEQIRAYRLDRARLLALERKGLVTAVTRKSRYAVDGGSVSLTDEQAEAVDSIAGALDRFGAHVLYGITGSGKTEVYLRLIAKVLAQSKQALVLVPEISLTPQSLDRVRERFGAAATIHSRLPAVARFHEWTRCAKGEHRILVGTRSAVFTPFSSLGLIVVDEEHDTSYKQQDGLRYSARDVALVRAQHLGIPCVLGSATPSTETLYNVRQGRFRVSHLSSRPGSISTPSMKILDLRGQEMRGGLSVGLIAKMSEHLGRNSQVLVLINRRGFAPSLICPDCSWRSQCQDCDARLTLHEYPNRQLQCHHCCAVHPVPVSCPDCESDGLVSLGSGTQRIDETLAAEFPCSKVYRIDRDAMTTRRKIDSTLREIRNSENSILVGTQMLAKGHHFPNVTLVAVIDADRGFLTSDFRGPERTAQLIMQVAGRAGREDKPGEVWIQSFDPENRHLKELAKGGYQRFIDQELESREEAALPPYTYMAVVRADSEDREAAERCVAELLDGARAKDLEVLGPAPAQIERVSKRWKFQGAIVARSRQRLHDSLRDMQYRRQRTSGVRWSIDVDPSELS